MKFNYFYEQRVFYQLVSYPRQLCVCGGGEEGVKRFLNASCTEKTWT